MSAAVVAGGVGRWFALYWGLSLAAWKLSKRYPELQLLRLRAGVPAWTYINVFLHQGIVLPILMCSVFNHRISMDRAAWQRWAYGSWADAQPSPAETNMLCAVCAHFTKDFLLPGVTQGPTMILHHGACVASIVLLMLNQEVLGVGAAIMAIFLFELGSLARSIWICFPIPSTNQGRRWMMRSTDSVVFGLLLLWGQETYPKSNIVVFVATLSVLTAFLVGRFIDTLGEVPLQ